MGKNIIRVTSSRKEAVSTAKRLNKSFSERKLKRKAYVTPVSYGYVRSLTRKGYPVKKKNFGVAVKDK